MNHLIGLIERLGIAAQTKPKLKPMGAGSLVVDPAKGEADIGVGAILFILAEPGAELLGPLPLELQNYVVYSIGAGAAAKDASAAKAFITFFSNPGTSVGDEGQRPGARCIVTAPVPRAR